MAFLTECLPVVRIPEELRITTMRSYVIDHCRLRVLALLQALLTEWMCNQVHLPGFVPSGTITSGRCRPHFFRVHAFMLFTIFLPVRQQEVDARNDILRDSYFILPLQSTAAAAGPGNAFNDLKPQPFFVKKNRFNAEADTLIRVSGHSMEPVE